MLRRDLNVRAQHLAGAQGLLHEHTTGGSPSVIFGCDERGRHGNFHPASYAAILENPEWARRLGKVHTAHARSRARADWQWRELDCANSSDALLMNIFCHPEVFREGRLAPAVEELMNVSVEAGPEFGIHPGVPLRQMRRGRASKRRGVVRGEATELFAGEVVEGVEASKDACGQDDSDFLKDRTEIDLRLGDFFVEAKLTESGFQSAGLRLIERYRDLEEVFDVARLPRRRRAVAQPEVWEEPVRRLDEDVASAVSTVNEAVEGYQLIRNVLAAYAEGAAFSVLCDGRRRDLIESWYGVLSAVHAPGFAWRLKLLTWQELAAVLPVDLRGFLEAKYGIRAGG